MSTIILINATPEETRVALLEGGRLAELHTERTRDRGIVGNIYKGKVVRVLPGMQAAFVDIGTPKAGFLHVADFQPGVEALPLIDADAIERRAEGASEEEADASHDIAAPPDVGQPREDEDPAAVPLPPLEPIETRLSRDDEILVQIAKDPLGSKGPRITSHISLPGRYLVYLPTTNHVGISRRIEDENERQRLRDDILALKPPDAGFIIRTVCVGLSRRELEPDIHYLIELWNRILTRGESVSAPRLLHNDMDLVLRTIRDLFTTDVDKVIVDRPLDQQRILELIDSFAPQLKSRIELHEGPEPLFDRWGVEADISRALERRVWLKSGGYIVIDQTEALATIDVNTGRYVGKSNHEATVLKTNLQAASEIVDQLRIRNIGGIIIIDFIDMMDPDNRQRLMDAFDAALKRDKMRSNILKISELGLVEMTRKRTRASLSQLLTEPCPTCDTRGRIKSVATTAYEVLRRIRQVARAAPEATELLVRAHPSVATFLSEAEGAATARLEREIGSRITVETAEGRDHNLFEVRAR